MHRLRKAAVMVAAVGTIGLMTSGTAFAGGEHGGHVWQSSNCKDHDLNLDVIGNLGLLNGLLGNALNGEGDPGAQSTHVGSVMGCDNSAGR
ncbi:hypothetical protein [Streptomyces alanosinicus]|uniref:Secreted protein n=1 Tax=Streptomyces alanosinicus TaxID=68171 RepID=A0A918YEX6_9ACTN|nr:hypothetical protein [Streptomyces alanosinicus]GHE01461.1 hypothetical protein GCM10010339_20760 [Streptomyces alanosinicus]